MTSWLAFTLNMAGLVLLGKKIAWGWLFGIASECLWIQVAMQNDIPALMLMGGVYIGLAGWSFYSWRAE